MDDAPQQPGEPQPPPAGVPGPPPPPPPAAPPPPPVTPPVMPPAPGGWQPAQPAWQPAPVPMRPRGPHGQPMFGSVELATWWSRAGALLLDALFAILPIIVGAILAATDSTALQTIGIIIVVAGVVWCYFVYYPVFMMRSGERNGQSLGKQIAGIRVVRDHGEPMTYGWALLREFVVRGLLFGVVGSFFFSLPILLDYLWPIWDESNRALHDMVVSTHVVRADPPPGTPPPAPGGVSHQAQQIGLG